MFVLQLKIMTDPIGSEPSKSGDSGYKDYVGNEAHMREYAQYQSKYAHTIRESDRKLIDLIARHIGDGADRKLLDMGCSTGNLLLHLRNRFPQLHLAGADVVASVIEANRANSNLTGVEFSVVDMLEMPGDRQYDVVVANAALMFFDAGEFERAVCSLGRALAAGGLLVVFDLFHGFETTIAVTEQSRAHPHGLKFYLRTYEEGRRAIRDAGLAVPYFTPWDIPIDLPRPSDPADMTSYTLKSVTGERLIFRGAVYQPWCHVTARRQ